MRAPREPLAGRGVVMQSDVDPAAEPAHVLWLGEERAGVAKLRFPQVRHEDTRIAARASARASGRCGSAGRIEAGAGVRGGLAVHHALGLGIPRIAVRSAFVGTASRLDRS